MTLSQLWDFGKRNHARRNIHHGLSRGVESLMAAGVMGIVLGGSFLSQKDNPRDADSAWWYNPEVGWSVLDKVFPSPDCRQALGKDLLDQAVDGIEDSEYSQSHEHFLQFNRRMPFGHQRVGMVKIVPEVQIDYIHTAQKQGT